MTVRINKPALNLREELTKAQGVVRYEQRQFWMDGLVENGTFDTTDGWALGGDWSIAGGSASKSGGGGGSIITSFPTKSGRRLKVVFNLISYTSGAVNIFVDGNYVTVDSSVGVKSHVFTTNDTLLSIGVYGNSGSTFSIDNVAVFEVDENDNVIHSVPLGFKPVHVYEDGLLQRQGENYDYTVVDTGFEYQIKPTVAPTGATETCVIAEREL